MEKKLLCVRPTATLTRNRNYTNLSGWYNGLKWVLVVNDYGRKIWCLKNRFTEAS